MHLTQYMFLSGLLLKVYVGAYSQKGQLSEYCNGETFNPTCSSDEVVVMKKVIYGHIKLGRCVDQDFGHLGCYIDQMSVMDAKCSGKRSCEMIVTDPALDGEFPCTLSKSLTRYLEASFSCLKVFTPDCDGHINVNSRFNYLSSEVTRSLQCSDSTTWELKAKEGQTINITFTDFNWKVKSRDDATENCPVKYGYILDMETNGIVYLCGGLTRERHLYTSKGNHVQVLIDKDAVDLVNFLVGYKALGCPKYKSPPDTWTEEKEGYIAVGCVSSDDQWKMRCIGSHWLGPVKDCSKYISKSQEVKSAQAIQDDNRILNMPPAVALSLFGGGLLVLCSITITVVIGLFCIRRKAKGSKNNIYMGHSDFKPPVMVPLDNFATYKSVQVKLPIKKDSSAATSENPFGSISTLPSMGIVPRHPPNRRESPHYYLLEGREPTETEPLYDVVYQGLPANNNV